MTYTDTFYNSAGFGWTFTDGDSEAEVMSGLLYKTSGGLSLIRTRFTTTTTAGNSYTMRIKAASVAGGITPSFITIKTVTLSSSQTGYTDVTSLGSIASGPIEYELTIEVTTPGAEVSLSDLIVQYYKL